jgi:hypothetical protein
MRIWVQSMVPIAVGILYFSFHSCFAASISSRVVGNFIQMWDFFNISVFTYVQVKK